MLFPTSVFQKVKRPNKVTMSKEIGQRSMIEKFKGDNYDAWAYRVRTKLESKDLWKYVESEITLPSTATDKEKSEHNIKLARAKDKIVKALDVNVIVQGSVHAHTICA